LFSDGLPSQAFTFKSPEKMAKGVMLQAAACPH
jgi:hypothetical protein